MSNTRSRVCMEVQLEGAGGESSTFVFRVTDLRGQGVELDHRGVVRGGTPLVIFNNPPAKRKMPRYAIMLLLGYLARVASEALQNLGAESSGANVRIDALRQFEPFQGYDRPEKDLCRAMSERFAPGSLVRFEKTADDRYWFRLEIGDGLSAPGQALLDAAVSWLSGYKVAAVQSFGSAQTRSLMHVVAGSIVDRILLAFSPPEQGGVDRGLRLLQRLIPAVVATLDAIDAPSQRVALMQFCVALGFRGRLTLEKLRELYDHLPREIQELLPALVEDERENARLESVRALCRDVVTQALGGGPLPLKVAAAIEASQEPTLRNLLLRTIDGVKLAHLIGKLATMRTSTGQRSRKVSTKAGARPAIGRMSMKPKVALRPVPRKRP